MCAPVHHPRHTPLDNGTSVLTIVTVITEESERCELLCREMVFIGVEVVWKEQPSSAPPVRGVTCSSRLRCTSSNSKFSGESGLADARPSEVVAPDASFGTVVDSCSLKTGTDTESEEGGCVSD